jgi:hypothetical protein
MSRQNPGYWVRKTENKKDLITYADKPSKKTQNTGSKKSRARVDT